MKPRHIKGTGNKGQNKRREFPEMQVGFPERNDASSPNEEMERVHVDLDTLDISRKNAGEVSEIAKEESSKEKE